MDWTNLDLAWPVVGAIVAGGLIGFEREYHGRPAGFRTHMLVCLSSALLMLAAVHQVRWLSDTPQEVIRIDPVRMAHGVLTGIGFLCGGVIFRQGFNVHGLTTAASLWITSALGILYGVGFFGLALGGTAATLVVLTAMNLTEAVMPKIRHVDIRLRYPRSANVTESQIRARLAAHHLKADAVSQQLLENGMMEFGGAFRTRGRFGSEALAIELCADPQIVGFEVSPRHE